MGAIVEDATQIGLEHAFRFRLHAPASDAEGAAELVCEIRPTFSKVAIDFGCPS